MQKNLFSRRNFLGFAGIAVGTATIATLAGCAPGENAGGDGGTGGGEDPKFELIRKMQERGHAILGFVDSPPSTMVRDGKATGYNVEITMAILAKYGITEVEAFQSDFAGMIPGLQSGQMDMCIAGLLITDERCETIAMSAATNVLIYTFAVPPGNPLDLAAIDDLNGTGAILAVEAATTQERVAREILPAEQILTVSGRQDGADAVRIGRADAYLAPVENVKQVLASGGDPLDITDAPTDMPKIGSCMTMRL